MVKQQKVLGVLVRVSLPQATLSEIEGQIKRWLGVVHSPLVEVWDKGIQLQQLQHDIATRPLKRISQKASSFLPGVLRLLSKDDLISYLMSIGMPS
jgi:hypothetical protein